MSFIIQHKYVEKNNYGNDYVVGDIHGSYSLLIEKLAEIGFDFKKDRLFSVGDIIDRGEENIECIKLLDEEWFYCVMGNHEMMMIDSIIMRDDISLNMWMGNGGEWFSRLSETEIDCVLSYMQIIRELPITITVGTDNGYVGICHAEPPSMDWKMCMDGVLTDHEINICLWSRSILKSPEWMKSGIANVYKTYHGHTPRKNIVRIQNCNWLDKAGPYPKTDLFIEKIN